MGEDRKPNVAGRDVETDDGTSPEPTKETLEREARRLRQRDDGEKKPKEE